MILTKTPSPTLEQVLTEATAYLKRHDLSYGHGTSVAEDDAAWLILEAAGLSPLDAPDYDQLMEVDALEVAEGYLVKRATEKIPAAYIVGRMWFAGLEFFVDSRVLVPRSPLSEFLVEDGFGLVDPMAVSKVLDLCTGGGCIAIACAHAFPNAIVDAADISDEALEVAKINVEKHALQLRVNLLQGDLFDPVGSDYDLIISNPPYVDARDIGEMGAEFRHEPMLGLTAGDDGLEIAHRILAESAERLSDKGILVCEVGNSAEALVNYYPDLPFNWFEFANGGDGVFFLSKQELLTFLSKT